MAERGHPPVVLFVCVQNAGRSQIAEALLNDAADGMVLARSAGSRPTTKIHPEVMQVLDEIGVDVSNKRPVGLTPDVTEGVDVVVTMGCGDECPVIPGARVIDWDIADPAGRPVAEVRAIREEIRSLIAKLVSDLLGPQAARTR